MKSIGCLKSHIDKEKSNLSSQIEKMLETNVLPELKSP